MIASSTSASSRRLNEARTYGVLPPPGRKTVPGSARTPFSRAFPRMTCSESSSSPPTPGSLSRSLNLETVSVYGPDIQRSEPNGPEKHACLRCVPLCKPIKVLLHVLLEDVALRLVELGHGERVCLEPIVSPRAEERVRDRLGQPWGLQACNRRLIILPLADSPSR